MKHSDDLPEISICSNSPTVWPVRGSSYSLLDSTQLQEPMIESLPWLYARWNVFWLFVLTKGHRSESLYVFTNTSSIWAAAHGNKGFIIPKKLYCQQNRLELSKKNGVIMSKWQLHLNMVLRSILNLKRSAKSILPTPSPCIIMSSSQCRYALLPHQYILHERWGFAS